MKMIWLFLAVSLALSENAYLAIDTWTFLLINHFLYDLMMLIAKLGQELLGLELRL